MSAAIQSPDTSQSPRGVNFAPLQPLLKLKDGGKRPSTYIQKAIQERFKHFMAVDRDVFREMYAVAQLTTLFLDGQQLVARNQFDGTWGVLPVRREDYSTRRSINLMGNIKQNLLVKWGQSTPDISIRPARNLDTAATAAKGADIVNNHYERLFFDAHYSEQECLMGMTCGTYINRIRADDSVRQREVLRDVFEQKQVQIGDGFNQCPDCGYGGPQSTCPDCGQPTYPLEPAAMGLVQSVARQEKKQVGDLVCDLLPFYSCRWDLAKRPEDSRWFIYSQRIPRGEVVRTLGNVALPNEQDIYDYGLEILRGLSAPGQPLSGVSLYGNRRNNDQQRDEVVFNELWMSPADYADINLIGDEETIDGQRLNKGRLIDEFPDGLCAVGLNGMAVVLGLYKERHHDTITSGTWFGRAQTGAGRGLADTVEVQKRLNATDSQQLAYQQSTATPAIMYDKQILPSDRVKYLGSPNTNFPVDLTKLPENRKLSDSIYQYAPASIPGQFFDYTHKVLNVWFQKTSMVTDYDQGQPGITASNTTATAAQIDQANADTLNEPIFQIKALARKRNAEVTIDQFRKYQTARRPFLTPAKYGRQQEVQLGSADICADLLFEVVKNSWIPNGPFTRRQNVATVVQMFGTVPDLFASIDAKPKQTDSILREYGVDFASDEVDEVAEICRQRLDQMTQAAQVANDPIAILESIQPPISEVEPKQTEKMKWFADFLDWDEGQKAKMPLRQAIEMLVTGQYRLAVQQSAALALGEGIAAASAQAPAALGAAQLEQQPESTEPDPSAQLQFAQEQSTQQHEQEQNALDREHELTMMDKELEKDKQTAKVEADNKIRIERSKPKKPAAKPTVKK